MAQDKKPDLTPMQRIAELETQLTTITAERDSAKTDLAARTTERDAAVTDATTAKTQLATEKSEHAATKVKLAEADAEFTTEKAAHDLLKTDYNAKVIAAASGKAAEIAAAQGIPAVGSKPAQGGKQEIADPKERALTAWSQPFIKREVRN